MICTTCDAETADGIYLCERHEKELWDLLGQIPETLADARDTVARLDARRDVGRSGSTPGAPVNLEASERVTALHELLVSWSRMLHEQTGTEGDAGAEYLRANLRAIVGSDWAGDMLDELQAAHRRVIQAIDTAPDYRTYGPCHIEDCPGLIRGQVGDTLARCRTCHEPYDATELMRTAVSNAWDERAPLTAVVRALQLAGVNLNYRTVQSWANRGRLAPSHESGGKPAYTMAQVFNAYQESETP